MANNTESLGRLSRSSMKWVQGIQLKEVKSSRMSGIGYESYANRANDEEPIGIMVITFAKGGKYAYFDVKESDYRKLISAPSVGKAFNEIVNGVYQYQRIG